MRPHEVELVIDRLVLHGSAPGLDGPLLKATVEAELTRLIAERGLPDGLGAGARPRVRAPGVVFPPAGDAGALGRRIAAGIYGGLAP